MQLREILLYQMFANIWTGGGPQGSEAKRLANVAAHHRLFILTAVIGAITINLVGCGSGSSAPEATSVVSSGVSGFVHGGQQPVTGATVQLYAAGATGDGSPATPLLQKTVTTDQNGSFTITSDYTCPTANTLVYLVALHGNPGLPGIIDNSAIAMMAALGPCGGLTPTTYIFVDELTTVGTLAALYPYMNSYNQLGSGASDATQLAAAFSLVNQYTNITSGTVPGPALAVGYYASSVTINTLADILAACINSTGPSQGGNSACNTLFSLSTIGTSAPSDTISALLNILSTPTQNTSALMALDQADGPYQPTLSNPPTSWQLPILPNPAPPAILPGTDTYSGPQTISIFDSTPGVALFYTLDGSKPTVYSTPYTGPLLITSTTTVSAIATNILTTSDESQAIFTVLPPASSSVAVTISGTVSSVTATGSGSTPNFTGQPFTLTYRINPAIGQQAQQCETSYLFSFCLAGISGSQGGSVLTIGTFTYADGGSTSFSQELEGFAPSAIYTSTLSSANSFATVVGISSTSSTQTTPALDWRASFANNQILSPVSYAGVLFFEPPATIVTAHLAPTSITASGLTCTTSQPELSLDITNSGKQPNILGGSAGGSINNIPYGNSTTMIDAYAAPTGDSLRTVSFGDLDASSNSLLADEGFQAATLLNTAGDATIQYYTNNNSQAINDLLTATTCGVPSQALPVYEYYPFLDSAQTTHFDLGRSQVTDDAFTNYSALSPGNIQSLFAAASSWLSNFYLDTDNPSNGGWLDSNPNGTGTSDVFNGSYVAYCPYENSNGTPICPVPGDQGISAAALIANAGYDNKVNPEVLLATLQKEYGVALSKTMPSNSALNQAMGVGNTDFQDQINAAARTFANNFNSLSESQFPYFFAANQSELDNYYQPPCSQNGVTIPPPCTSVVQSIQYSWNSPVGAACNRYIHTNCAIVGFWVADRATYAQYTYTPFVQTTVKGGGVYSFEYWWLYGMTQFTL
jgi:hypothetical protein